MRTGRQTDRHNEAKLMLSFRNSLNAPKNCLTIDRQLYNCTTAQLYSCTTVQLYNCTTKRTPKTSTLTLTRCTTFRHQGQDKSHAKPQEVSRRTAWARVRPPASPRDSYTGTDMSPGIAVDPVSPVTPVLHRLTLSVPLHQFSIG